MAISVEWSDSAVWAEAQFGKKPHSGCERSETAAVTATSEARKHKKGRSGDAGRTSGTRPEQAARNERTRAGLEVREGHEPAEEKGRIIHISDGAGGRGPRSRLRGKRLQGRGVRGPQPWMSATAGTASTRLHLFIITVICKSPKRGTSEGGCHR